MAFQAKTFPSNRYLDNRVFVALANGDICVYLRDGIIWNTTSSHCLTIGSVTSPVTKLLNVHGKLWCSTQGIIKVLDTDTFTVSDASQVDGSIFMFVLFSFTFR